MSYTVDALIKYELAVLAAFVIAFFLQPRASCLRSAGRIPVNLIVGQFNVWERGRTLIGLGGLGAATCSPLLLDLGISTIVVVVIPLVGLAVADTIQAERIVSRMNQ